jgi:hypothetical protein
MDMVVPIESDQKLDTVERNCGPGGLAYVAGAVDDDGDFVHHDSSGGDKNPYDRRGTFQLSAGDDEVIGTIESKGRSAGVGGRDSELVCDEEVFQNQHPL